MRSALPSPASTCRWSSITAASNRLWRSAPTRVSSSRRTRRSFGSRCRLHAFPGRLEPVDVVGDGGALEVNVGGQSGLGSCSRISLKALEPDPGFRSEPPAAVSVSSNASRIVLAVNTS